MPDDIVPRDVRWTARFVAPFLVAGGAVLFILPTRTDHLWAWTVRPNMTVLAMGAGYLGGAVFFVRAGRAARWHTVALGLIGADVLATLLLVATIVHWDRFHHDNPAFWIWTALYVVTPVLLPVLWLRNRRRDPRVVEPGDVRVPDAVRWGMGGLGAGQLILALAIFAHPVAWLDVWPWKITPLTARTLAAFFAFIAVTWLAFFFERRWSALRLHVESASLGLGLVLIGVLVARSDFDRTIPAWAFALLLVGILAGLGWLQWAMRSAARRAARSAG